MFYKIAGFIIIATDVALVGINMNLFAESGPEVGALMYLGLVALNIALVYAYLPTLFQHKPDPHRARPGVILFGLVWPATLFLLGMEIFIRPSDLDAG